MDTKTILYMAMGVLAAMVVDQYVGVSTMF